MTRSSWIVCVGLAALGQAGCLALRAGAGESVTLRGLAFQGGVLEGELVNRSPRAVRAVVVAVDFRDASGNTVLAQEFRAVPGGDGRGLSPRQAKHFRYKLGLAADSAPSVHGRVKSVVYD